MFDIRLLIEGIKFSITFLLGEGFLPIGEREWVRVFITVSTVLLSFVPFVRNEGRAVKIIRPLEVPRKFKTLTLKESRQI